MTQLKVESLKKISLSKIKRGRDEHQSNTRLSKRRDSNLEGDLSGHGEPVGDVGLFFLGSALPAVQLYAATACQQHLPVHLHWRQTSQLTHWKTQTQEREKKMGSDPKKLATKLDFIWNIYLYVSG